MRFRCLCSKQQHQECKNKLRTLTQVASNLAERIPIVNSDSFLMAKIKETEKIIKYNLPHLVLRDQRIVTFLFQNCCWFKGFVRGSGRSIEIKNYWIFRERRTCQEFRKNSVEGEFLVLSRSLKNPSYHYDIHILAEKFPPKSIPMAPKIQKSCLSPRTARI